MTLLTNFILDYPSDRQLGDPGVLRGVVPWRLEGRVDPWLSVPVFRRVWLCRCRLLSVMEDRSGFLIFSETKLFRASSDVRFGSLAAVFTNSSLMSGFGGKADAQLAANSIA